MPILCLKSLSQEWIGIFGWNFERILKGGDQLTKRLYVHGTINTTTATTFTTATASTSSTNTSVTTTC